MRANIYTGDDDDNNNNRRDYESGRRSRTWEELEKEEKAVVM